MKKFILSVLFLVFLSNAYERDSVVANALGYFKDAKFVLIEQKKYKLFPFNFKNASLVIVYGIVQKDIEDSSAHPNWFQKMFQITPKEKFVTYCAFKEKSDTLSMYDYGEIPYLKKDVEYMILQDLERSGVVGGLR